jgi:hypothetical protein
VWVHVNLLTKIASDDLKEIDVLVERLREFVRLNYMTAAEIAREIGVRDTISMTG